MSLAFAVACADSPGTGDDDQGDDTSGNTCGDGTCATAEIGYCPTDCGDGNGNNGNNAVCGNGQCETTKGESASTCFSDCGGNNNGSGSGQQSGSCPADPNACIGCLLDPSQCPSGLDMNSCLQCVLNGGGLGSGFPGGSGLGSGACNFNQVCDSGEDATGCPTDCP
ncbi:MAG TPA: hypothetical protein VMZ53_17450 [Kofleriaceae bacterium]|nr:hypothetical protein [Kofleriaceae bacterium]